MYDQSGHEKLEAAGAAIAVVDTSDTDALKQELGNAKAIWIRTPERITADIMDAAPELVVISTSGFGTDNVDIPAASERGILVVNHLGFGRTPVSEHTIMLLLAVMNRLNWADPATRDASGYGVRSSMDFYELEGKTVGLLGLGYIGSELARKLSLAFRCRVLAYDPYVDARIAPSVNVERVDALDDLLKVSQALCICAELTDETRTMISHDELKKLPEGAVVINTARGQILDLDALSDVLEEGHLLGAGIDVTYPEPLPLDHPLFERDNVVFTPHTAGLSVEAAAALTQSAVDQIMSVLGGGQPEFPVNPAAWEGKASRRPE
jgi:phosphoglycerate dehydrogenase-like enzyme